MANDTDRGFGGGWSDEKLEALRAYLAAYGRALSKTSFERIYIDAFAGAGVREVLHSDDPGLFPEALPEEDVDYRHGSPLVALGTEPGFHRFIFIEQDPESIARLRAQISAEFPNRLGQVTFRVGDANEELAELAGQSWNSRRAVAFLDPFALHVSWETIERIAGTEAIDMWLLFPAMAVNRMLPKSGKVPEQWAAKLTATFGSDEWRSYFYEQEPPDMFGEESTSKQPKVFDRLSEFITMRLRTVFAGVNTKPLILRNSTGSPLFLLCFASGNPRGASIAVKIANHIINKSSHGR